MLNFAAQQIWRTGVGVFTLVVLAACSSVPLDPPKPAPKVSASRPTPPAPVVHQDWEPAPQGGGYYLDDGPGDLRPANLGELPSAVPQVEPIAIPNTRPYTVMGQSFTPQTSLEEPYQQKGRASWYGRKFHGAKTANGEIYDMHQMTAAHPTLPLPSYAKVTNLANGKSVIVRVNDRGPFLRGRIIDLSYAAAYQLDYINQGSAEVIVEKLTPDAIAAYHAEKNGTVVTRAGVSVSPVAHTSNSKPVVPQRTPLYLQIGAFSSKSNAEALVGQVAANQSNLGKGAQILSESGVHRVLVGPFASIDQANEAAIELTAFVSVQPIIKQDLILP
ncbi:MAG TPA: septal ring lytic transglycosylase RlpA family protein [Limnobacter sp.]|nr:septal ring lytic transglycosylase RlpA family protein [Limnobacter sp.]